MNYITTTRLNLNFLSAYVGINIEMFDITQPSDRFPKDDKTHKMIILQEKGDYFIQI